MNRYSYPIGNVFISTPKLAYHLWGKLNIAKWEFFLVILQQMLSYEFEDIRWS